MANEITLQTNPVLSAITAYATISDSTAQYWNTSTEAFEAYDVDNAANYVIAMTESASVSGLYTGSIPLAIPEGLYSCAVYQQRGGSPAVTDDVIGFVGVNSGGAEPTGTDLVSVVYVQSVLGITGHESALVPLIYAASQAVKNFCRRDFVPGTYTEDHDVWEETGDGIYQQSRRRIFLRQTPVTALTAITLDPYGATPQTLDVANYYVTTIGELRAKPTATEWLNLGYGFGCGKIRVEYSAGFPFVPNDVRYWTARLVGDWLRGRLRDGMILKERLGDWNYELRPDGNALSPDVRSGLTPYRYMICVA